MYSPPLTTVIQIARGGLVAATAAADALVIGVSGGAGSASDFAHASLMLPRKPPLRMPSSTAARTRSSKRTAS